MGVTTWTKAQDVILIDGLKGNQTYKQIADTLGLSKAMISGRIRRLRKLRPNDLPPKTIAPDISSKAQEKRAIHCDKPNLNYQKNRYKDGVRLKSNAKLKPVSTINWKLPSILVEKPINRSVEFMHLKQGTCSWCLDDINQEAGARMMCCAAPVMDKSKREGDRRSSHCVYHYEMSVRRL
ncbi:MAG: hypothetical protein ABJO57_00600 [Lentilitoribacter sp.]